MKKLFLFPLALCLVPALSWAENDSCSYPEQYTVDKRCYVTETQKNEKPYNSVVAFVFPWAEGSDPKFLNDSDCTGTVIKMDNKLYVFTAKHCVRDYRGNANSYMTVMTQDGDRFQININNSSQTKLGTSSVIGAYIGALSGGDWAIYSVPDEYKHIASTGISQEPRKSRAHDARVVGYGGLKVMSDAEIKEYKRRYIQYLKEEKGSFVAVLGKGAMYYPGLGSVRATDYNTFVGYLCDTDVSYYEDLFEDNRRLKVSKCKYTDVGIMPGCQVWGGNSGGGVFDNDGNLMAIMIAGTPFIGGYRHAKAGAAMKVFQESPIRPIVDEKNNNK